MDPVCDCCYVLRGLVYGCNCLRGPTRLDPRNSLGPAEPWINTTMGRNEPSDEERAARTARHAASRETKASE